MVNWLVLTSQNENGRQGERKIGNTMLEILGFIFIDGMLLMEFDRAAPPSVTHFKE